MAHKWKIGDRARYVSYCEGSHRSIPLGTIVIIRAVGDFISKRSGDIFPICLENQNPDGSYVICHAYQLEPIIDLGNPSEKEELVPVGSWDELQKSIGWNPTKQKELI